MPFERARHVLHHIREVHRTAATLYHRASERTASPRVRMLLDYLEGHEKRFEKGLERFERYIPPGTMHAFFQNSPDAIHPPESLQELSESTEPTQDEVLDAALELDRWIENCYRQMAEIAPTATTREAFRGLEKQQAAEQRLIVTQVQMMDDL
ncbi:MAG: hypothetical protein CMJ83_21695 [Planctomycetes bacterium]|nr:hypothetical protein [Planctomycetota bacterium]